MMAKTVKTYVESDSDRTSSRTKLVEAATELFIRKGFRNVSIREIADAAGTNSALISYYFGDKEGLFTQVFKNTVAPFNTTRMIKFDLIEKTGVVTVESVVEAWVAPMFQGTSLAKQSPVATLTLSLDAEYSRLTEQLVVEVYDEVNERFLSLLERCLLGVSRPTLVWRLYFLVGAWLMAARPHNRSAKNLSGGLLNLQDPEELIAQLVAFAAAGFRASEPPPRRQISRGSSGGRQATRRRDSITPR
jgi:AcrR family transcriptional regulator